MRYRFAKAPEVSQPIEQPKQKAPSGPVIPDRYRNAASLQTQAENTIQRVLGHCSPELVGKSFVAQHPMNALTLSSEQHSIPRARRCR